MNDPDSRGYFYERTRQSAQQSGAGHCLIVPGLPGNSITLLGAKVWQSKDPQIWGFVE